MAIQSVPRHLVAFQGGEAESEVRPLPDSEPVPVTLAAIGNLLLGLVRPIELAAVEQYSHPSCSGCWSW